MNSYQHASLIYRSEEREKKESTPPSLLLIQPIESEMGDWWTRALDRLESEIRRDDERDWYYDWDGLDCLEEEKTCGDCGKEDDITFIHPCDDEAAIALRSGKRGCAEWICEECRRDCDVCGNIVCKYCFPGHKWRCKRDN